MNRDDWLWVVIKAFGVYLLIRALLALPQTIASGIAAASFVTLEPSQSELDRAISTAQDTVISSFIGGSISVVLFGAAGIYLIRNGRLIHRLAAGQLAREG